MGITAGGLCGYLWYRFVGCSSGSCPIAANPYISVLYGAVLGYIISLP